MQLQGCRAAGRGDLPTSRSSRIGPLTVSSAEFRIPGGAMLMLDCCMVEFTAGSEPVQTPISMILNRVCEKKTLSRGGPRSLLHLSVSSMWSDAMQHACCDPRAPATQELTE